MPHVVLKQDEYFDTPVRLLRLVATATPRLRDAVQSAVAASQGSLGTLDELAALIEAGRTNEAIRTASRIAALRIATGYEAVFVGAGAATGAVLETQLEIVVGFSQVHEGAVRHMRDQRLRVIREFTQEQRRATRLALTDGIQRGVNPRQQARAFRSSIGLTEYQQQAVLNYRDALVRSSEGNLDALNRGLRDRRFDRTVQRGGTNPRAVEPGQINRMVERYRERYLIYRSEVIARTEALRSVHAGNREAYSRPSTRAVYAGRKSSGTWFTNVDGRERETTRRPTAKWSA